MAWTGGGLIASAAWRCGRGRGNPVRACAFGTFVKSHFLNLSQFVLGPALSCCLLARAAGYVYSAEPETAPGWIKYANNPVLGGQYGTCFDVSVLKEAGKYRMWVSWRPKQSVALVESENGFRWSQPPVIVLGPNKESGWEDEINRPVVLKRGGVYHMWYTGQAKGHSAIGYATSQDGLTWKRMSARPVLTPAAAWEKVAVMCPHVNWDAQARLFKM